MSRLSRVSPYGHCHRHKGERSGRFQLSVVGSMIAFKRFE